MKNLIFILIMCVCAVSCRTSRLTTIESDRQTVKTSQDSSWVKETVKVDTFRVKADTVRLFLTHGMLSDTNLPVLEKHSGRATLTAKRTSGGIVLTASCDSLEALLLNKTVEAYHLRLQLDNEKLSRSISDSKTTVVYKTPWGLIIPCVIVLCCVLLFEFLKIKKFIP